jgi:hypothetical protein
LANKAGSDAKLLRDALAEFQLITRTPAAVQWHPQARKEIRALEPRLWEAEFSEISKNYLTGKTDFKKALEQVRALGSRANEEFKKEMKQKSKPLHMKRIEERTLDLLDALRKQGKGVSPEHTLNEFFLVRTPGALRPADRTERRLKDLMDLLGRIPTPDLVRIKVYDDLDVEGGTGSVYVTFMETAELKDAKDKRGRYIAWRYDRDNRDWFVDPIRTFQANNPSKNR